MASQYQFPRSALAAPPRHSIALPNARALSRTMSRHCAGALMLFAAWQAYIILALPTDLHRGILPWLGLAVLMLIMLPFTQRRDRRWGELSRLVLVTPALVHAHRRDKAAVWLAALVLPPVWTLAALTIISFFT